jgi:hypothetical protein
MALIKNALFLDKLLDKWDAAAPAMYFQTLVGLPPAAGAAGAAPPALVGATIQQIQEQIHKLYLVFHYPQYDPFPTTAQPAPQTTFDSTKTDKPIVDNTKAVFNYVISDAGGGAGAAGGGKRLLSSAGIVKKDMINLKIIIDKLEKALDDAAVIKLLFDDTTEDITTVGVVMGGNNNTDMITYPKNTGGKNNNNRSNKKMKKQPRKRNKSSKSLR